MNTFATIVPDQFRILSTSGSLSSPILTSGATPAAGDRALTFTGIACYDRAFLDRVPDGPSDLVTVLAELIRERDHYHDKWLRAVAELDNLRKRTRRELADGRKFAVADLVRRGKVLAFSRVLSQLDQ